MSYQIITSNEKLASFCVEIAESEAIALDTEFVRTRTFYPHLGLLQVFNGQVAALIDPINITDWSCFIAILQSADIQKYLHACSEDIEVFHHHFNCIPANIVDSQILASFLDNAISTSYANLVKKYLNVELDKSETRTDWLKRPLTDKQCKYAINDVLYLFPLMAILKKSLHNTGWLAAAYDECQLIIARKCEQVDPSNVYFDIKNSWQLKELHLGQLQKLAQWRYELAKKQDIALNFVLQEELLLKIAKYLPSSLVELESLGMRGKELRLYGNIILAILQTPTISLPAIKRTILYPNYKKIATDLKQAAQTISKQTGLSEELLISRRLINHYVKWYNDKASLSNIKLPEIIIGWRKPLFEPYLSASIILS